MIILGLDLSMNSTGYAIIEVNRTDTIKSLLNEETEVILINKGIIKSKAKESHSTRLKRQYDTLDEIKERYSDEELIVVKEALHYSRPHTMAILAKVHGVVDLLFDDMTEYKPTTIKKHIAGNGKAKKEEVEDGVRDILKRDDITFATDDESDAVAVALTYAVLEG